jgi:hypothetical protein
MNSIAVCLLAVNHNMYQNPLNKEVLVQGNAHLERNPLCRVDTRVCPACRTTGLYSPDLCLGSGLYLLML